MRNVNWWKVSALVAFSGQLFAFFCFLDMRRRCHQLVELVRRLTANADQARPPDRPGSQGP